MSMRGSSSCTCCAQCPHLTLPRHLPQGGGSCLSCSLLVRVAIEQCLARGLLNRWMVGRTGGRMDGQMDRIARRHLLYGCWARLSRVDCSMVLGRGTSECLYSSPGVLGWAEWLNESGVSYLRWTSGTEWSVLHASGGPILR